LNDENVFRILFESVGGKWDEVQAPFRRFQKSVEGWSNFLKVGDVRKEVTSALSELKENDPLTTGARKKIADAIKRSSPWEALKTAGRHGVPAGQMIADFDGLVSAAASKRLWIVPVGEVESFCKTASAGHGPAWLRNVLTTYNVGTAPELTEARQFIERVYGGIRSLD
jgi:hypothetical protein